MSTNFVRYFPTHFCLHLQHNLITYYKGLHHLHQRIHLHTENRTLLMGYLMKLCIFSPDGSFIIKYISTFNLILNLVLRRTLNALLLHETQ